VALLIWAGLAAAQEQPVPALATNVLTTARQVLDLGQERARPRNIPVRLRGTLTYQDVFTSRFVFLQDETAGMVLKLDRFPFPIVPGQIVEADGMAEAGSIAPYVHVTNLILRGTGPMPVPQRTTPAYLAAANLFGYWVSITGTVRDVAISKERLVLVCEDGDIHFQVWATQLEPMELPTQLLDARVRLEGVPLTSVDDYGHANGFQLHQPGTNCITILKPGAADVFHPSSIAISALRGRMADRNERVKVTGVVTFSSPDGWLTMQDETASLVAHVFKPLRPDEDSKAQYVKRSFAPLQPGDRIELVGTPVATNTIAPDLQDAEYRVIGRSPVPALRQVSAAALAAGMHDGELVTFKAQVMDADSHLKAHIIDVERHHDLDQFEDHVWLQSDGLIFEALLQSLKAAPLPVERSEYVAVSGVCRVEPDQLQQARPVQIYLRGPEDIARRDPPPWWDSRQTLTILGIGTALSLATAAWIFLLRKRVAQQTAQLRASEQQLQHALDQEKQLHQLKTNFVSMVTHEIRTPLANILSSSEILQRYLDQLTPEERDEQLGSIHQAVDRMTGLLEDVLFFSRAEAGRIAFQSETFDLEAFCRQIAEETAAAVRTRNPIQVHIAGVAAPAFGDTTLLRHIMANLMGNAVKYSTAGAPVALEVTRQGDEAVLCVRDRGIGMAEQDFKQLFVPFFRGQNAAAVQGTGLGLLIVRHCVERHGGRMDIASTENVGTTVTVRLPVFAKVSAPSLPASKP
jgi:signal transduction histidine kinase